jgi:hypothetical protein
MAKGEKSMKIIIPLIVMLFSSQTAFASDGTYNAVVKGKNCHEDRNQILSCSYKVGKTLRINIEGIGSPNTDIVFLKSDNKGDYYGQYGTEYECVEVYSVKDKASVGFISPRNGKVYKSGQECEYGM